MKPWMLMAALGLAAPAGAQELVAQSTGLRTFAAEDVFEGGDHDQNDVVLRYNRRCLVDAFTDELARETLQLSAVAAGARRVNTLLLELPAPAETVTITRGQSAPELLTQQPDGAVVLFEDFRQAFDGASGSYVNTLVGQPVVPAVPTRVDIVYAAGTRVPMGATDPCEEPALAIANAQSPQRIDRFTTVGPNNKPLVGTFPGDWAVPAETIRVDAAYPDFLCFVTGAGCASWYQSPASGDVVLGRADLEQTAPIPELESCWDGVQNQEEEEVDCGGPLCAPCFNDLATGIYYLEAGYGYEVMYASLDGSYTTYTGATAYYEPLSNLTYDPISQYLAWWTESGPAPRAFYGMGNGDSIYLEGQFGSDWPTGIVDAAASPWSYGSFYIVRPSIVRRVGPYSASTVSGMGGVTIAFDHWNDAFVWADQWGDFYFAFEGAPGEYPLFPSWTEVADIAVDGYANMVYWTSPYVGVMASDVWTGGAYLVHEDPNVTPETNLSLVFDRLYWATTDGLQSVRTNGTGHVVHSTSLTAPRIAAVP